MNVISERTVTFRVMFSMGEVEAKELKNFVQNAFMDQEPEIATQLRSALFEALEQAGVQ